jgi:hypothetical protein
MAAFMFFLYPNFVSLKRDPQNRVYPGTASHALAKGSKGGMTGSSVGNGRLRTTTVWAGQVPSQPAEGRPDPVTNAKEVAQPPIARTQGLFTKSGQEPLFGVKPSTLFGMFALP